MNLEEAKNSVGKLVMSTGRKSNKLLPMKESHGPYRLLQITKSGHAILEGLEEYRAKPSELTLYQESAS